MKRRIKGWLGRALSQSTIARMAWKGQAMIAVFHSVTEDRRSPIACTHQDFIDYCDLFERHFEVVSLSRLLDNLDVGADISRQVAITFDDGYLDNLEIAVPELDKRGMPATFFVVSDFIGSNQVAAWDASAGIRSRWMSWDDLRRLRDAGHEIGAHTASHLDLGVVETEAARRDILRCLDKMTEELSERPTLFAYPFGGRENLTEDARGIVLEVGLRCCVSCYGGLVTAGDDPFRLKRMPISPWYLSPYQYVFEAVRSR